MSTPLWFLGKYDKLREDNWLLDQLRQAKQEAATWSEWKRNAMNFDRIPINTPARDGHPTFEEALANMPPIADSCYQRERPVTFPTVEWAGAELSAPQWDTITVIVSPKAGISLDQHCSSELPTIGSRVQPTREPDEQSQD